MTKLAILGDDFTLDGKAFRILAGAMHYFRVMPEYWRDRMLKLKAMGLNTLETYVCWNLHEPRPGQFRFDGILDIERYIRLAGELGLHVIVRPGPYICSEWDFGGFPPWLLADPNLRVRCCYQPYLDAVSRYLDNLMPRLAALQSTRGGPIIAMQIENEYGSNGNDSKYLAWLEEGMKARGADVLLFTADGPCDSMLVGGTLPHVHKIANFGSRPKEAFASLRKHQPNGPIMCGEFWNGWFNHWGDAKRIVRSAADAAATLDEMLAAGASVNLYMFHGGTSFGFMAGANHNETDYQPDVSSYDYDAPVSEAGDLTPKYFAMRDVIRKYAPVEDIKLPPPSPKKAFGVVKLTQRAGLFGSLAALSSPVERPTPVTMETLGQDYGFILYRTHVQGPRQKAALRIQDVHDRAQVFVDGELRGVIYRNNPQPIEMEFTPGDHQIDILVEAMGRVNFGPRNIDRKGITEGARLDLQFLYGWTIYPLPLADLGKLKFEKTEAGKAGDSGKMGTGSPAVSACLSPIFPFPVFPAFFRGEFNVDAPADTFLALPGWTKGVAFVNGFNIGRYWSIGPQHTSYVPAPLLRKGVNELVILELHEAKDLTAEFRDTPDLGPEV